MAFEPELSSSAEFELSLPLLLGLCKEYESEDAKEPPDSDVADEEADESQGVNVVVTGVQIGKDRHFSEVHQASFSVAVVASTVCLF
jgi:hypothetical protein